MSDAPEKPKEETPQAPAAEAATPAAAAPAAGGAAAAPQDGGQGRGPGGGRGQGGRGQGGRGQGRGQGGRGRGGRGGKRGRGRDQDDDGPRFEERVVQINRVATTVKGGRRMSFSALVVLGDKKGKVGIGFGKAKAVPSAVEKAFKDARKSMVTIALDGSTIPHEVMGRLGAGRVLLMPASPGTGVIAGAPARAVLECAGVQDILTKSQGSANKINVAKATLEGLTRLKTKDQVEKLRGVSLS